MSVSSEVCEVTYTGNGATTAYPTTFKFIDEGDLTVTRTVDDGEPETLTLGEDYTVTGEGLDAGGTVTMAVAVVDGVTLTITRTMALTQDVDFRDQGSFSPRIHTRQFDRAMMASQQLKLRDTELTAEIASTREDLLAAIEGLGGGGAAFGELTPEFPRTSSNPLQVRVRSDGTYYQASEHGGRWQNIVPSSKVYDIREFGEGVGEQDETADTDAFLLLAAELSAEPGATQAESGVIKLPHATYLLADEVTLVGGTGYGVTMLGDGDAPRGLTGTQVKWVGDSGGTMMHWRGMNTSSIKGIQFNGNGLAAHGLWIREYNVGGQFIPSAGCVFESLNFSNFLADDASVAVKIGLDDAGVTSLQTSELLFRRCLFEGNWGGPGFAGVHIKTGANCKNFTFEFCEFSAFDYGIYQPVGSGITEVLSCSFGGIGFNIDDGWAVYMGGGNRLHVENFRMENSQTSDNALPAHAGAIRGPIQGVLDINGGYFYGRLPTSDIVIENRGVARIHGIHFEKNDRAGGNTCKVATDSAVNMTSCLWAWNTTALKNAPLYDLSTNHLLEGNYARSQIVNTGHVVESCAGGEFGSAPDNEFPNVGTRPFFNNRGALGIQYTGNGAGTGITWEEDTGRLTLSIPYTAWNGALAQVLRLCDSTAVTLIREVIVDVTTALAGPAGTLTLSVGTLADADALVLGFDCKTGTTTKGTAEADLGTALTAKRGVKYPADTQFSAELTSSSGNLNTLSAGVIKVTFLYDVI